MYSRSSSSAKSLITAATDLGFPNASSIDFYADDLASHGSGLAALLQRQDITAVLIALPILAQPDIVRQCLAAGKHVLCEKPIAQDVQTALQLITDYEITYRPRGLIFAIAEQMRYDLAAVRAKDLVRSRVGSLSHVHVRVWNNIIPGQNKWHGTEWRNKPGYQGGFILDAGVHFVALARFVTGQEVVRVVSLARQVHPHLPPVDTVNAALEFDGGAGVSLSVSFASSKPASEFVFSGELGTVSVLGTEGEHRLDSGYRVVFQKADGTVESDEVIDGRGVDEEVRAFLKAVGDGKADEKAAPRQALADVAVIESICSGGGQITDYTIPRCQS